MGKTATSANLAHAIALTGRKAAVIDLGPQGHLTAYLGFARQNQQGIGDVIRRGVDSPAPCASRRGTGCCFFTVSQVLKDAEITPVSIICIPAPL